MMSINVTTNARTVTRDLKQIPFALALALTRTAQDAQSEIRKELPRRFTLRNNWVSGGIRITKATKTNPEATVYSANDFMTLHQTGGTKTPQGKSLGIPIDVRTNKRGIVTRANRPGALRGKPNVFRATIRGVDGLWQRMRKRRKKGERSLKLLYVFKPSVEIKPRFGFLESGKQIATERFAANFDAAYAEAVRTAR